MTLGLTRVRLDGAVLVKRKVKVTLVDRKVAKGIKTSRVGQSALQLDTFQRLRLDMKKKCVLLSLRLCADTVYPCKSRESRRQDQYFRVVRIKGKTLQYIVDVCTGFAAFDFWRSKQRCFSNSVGFTKQRLNLGHASMGHSFEQGPVLNVKRRGGVRFMKERPALRRPSHFNSYHKESSRPSSSAPEMNVDPLALVAFSTALDQSDATI